MLDVIAIGEVLIDFTPAERIKEEKEQFICNPGGAPANVAAILARLGSRAGLVSKVGRDYFGTLLHEALLDCGVDASMLSFTDEAHTTLAFVHLNHEGDRSFSFYRKPGADTYLQPNDVPFGRVESCKILHFGSVSMTHEPARTATKETVERVKAAGALVSFDPNIRIDLWESSEDAKRCIFWGLSYADIVKVSEEELFFITGISDIEEGALALQQQFNITLTVVTLGAKGSYYRLSDHEGYVPGFSVQAVDTTGAGDAFIGSLLYKILEYETALQQLEQQQMISMLTFANAGGAIVTTRKGALQSMPTANEINNLIESMQPNTKNHRPEFHFSPPTNWLNDPNGLVYYEGVYHLFYQHHPYGNKWGPMHWGHAISQDLIHWQHEPIALFPDEHGTIFSGCCVVDWNNTSGLFDKTHGLVALFTHADTCPETGNPRQRQSLAFSSDSGKTWKKYEGNPVLAESELIDFRDPKVFWHEQSQKWVMVIVAGDRVRFYSSTNLREWSFTSEFGANHGSHDGVWECPDLFELPVGDSGQSKWVLIISIGDNPNCPEGSRTQYFIGEFDGETFISDYPADDVKWLDYGRDNYAGVTWSDMPEPDGRRVMIGWMSNWKYANETPTEEWRGAMTLPRVLSLVRQDEDLIVTQMPVQEVEQLRESSMSWDSITVTPDAPFTTNTKGAGLEIVIELDTRSGTETCLRLAAADQSETVIGYDPARQWLYIDRSNSGIIDFHEAFPCQHGAYVIPQNDSVKLHIWLDRSSVEVFANEGVTVLTDQIFPGALIDKLVVTSTTGQSVLNSLNIHFLHSIFHSN